DDGERQQRQARFECRIARRLLEKERQQERGGAESRVEREGGDVADREVAALEELERQHGVARVLLPPEEEREHREAADQRDVDERRTTATLTVYSQHDHQT